MRIQVKDFMSTPVTTAVGEDSVQEIRELMKEKGIHAVPIISYSNDTLKVDITIRGIITATDIGKDVNSNANVEDVMTSSSIHVIHTDSSANAAAKMMLRHEVHHIVVMDDGEIKGMISSMDFVKLVAEYSLE
ncbi:CBS domain-containing protein [Formosa sp. Hel1_31_208]|uniref:CBS domain-containing protein n=1 Tax=Formosa sp. Hel1_31_208 TaxID=1798225 RepID=UPI00087DC2D9|nr:CBS domain-containing protein [Formosa sp. Hel1_31_208]SDS40921.1 CBS domain-containing protein [Formosa sp. Hel1_31_208]